MQKETDYFHLEYNEETREFKQIFHGISKALMADYGNIYHRINKVDKSHPFYKTARQAAAKNIMNLTEAVKEYASLTDRTIADDKEYNKIKLEFLEILPDYRHPTQDQLTEFFLLFPELEQVKTSKKIPDTRQIEWFNFLKYMFHNMGINSVDAKIFLMKIETYLFTKELEYSELLELRKFKEEHDKKIKEVIERLKPLRGGKKETEALRLLKSFVPLSKVKKPIQQIWADYCFKVRHENYNREQAELFIIEKYKEEYSHNDESLNIRTIRGDLIRYKMKVYKISEKQHLKIKDVLHYRLQNINIYP